MKISLIIPTMNREKELQHLLESVFVQSRVPDELIIIDDGALDQKWLMNLVDAKMPLKYYKKDQPGLVRSRNKGVDLSEGEIISFLDDDTELAPNYFEVIEKIFENDADKKIVGVGAFIETKEEGILRAIKNCLEKIFFMRGREGSVSRATGNTFVETRPNGEVEVDWLPGCDMNFRREVFDKQTFDEFFTEYGLGEDLEFSFRVKRIEKRSLVITGSTSLQHFHTPTARIKERRLGYMMIHNHQYIFEKLVPQTWLNKAAFRWFVAGNIVLEALNKVSNPFKNRGGRIYGMFDALK